MSNSNRPGTSGETVGEEHLLVLGEATPPDTGSPRAGRDFGDAAGYGGGLTLDPVGAETAHQHQPSPLDAVTTSPSGVSRSDRHLRQGGRRPDIGLAFMAGSALLTVSLGLLLLRRGRKDQPRRRSA
jgi:hypothetical protein